jgi:replication factor A1
MKIKDIKPFQKKIDLIAKVVNKTEPRKVTSKIDNIEHTVCEAVLEDETGTILLTLWDNVIDTIDIGKIYVFRNLYSSEFKNEVRLNLGRFGTFEIAKSNMEI